MKDQRPLDPHAAAAAAARRLSSDRPLFAVSLSTAVSQLLKLTPTPESTACCSPSSIPVSCASSQAGRGALGVDGLPPEDRTFGRATGDPQHKQNTHVDAGQEVNHTLQAQWLTRRFIAQVRAHFEAVLAASPQEEGEAAEDGGEEASACEGKEKEIIMYQRSVCTAGLRWGLLLLLSAESALLTEPAHQQTPQSPAKGHPNKQNESCLSSEKTRLEGEALNCNGHDRSESVDAVLRGKKGESQEPAQVAVLYPLKEKRNPSCDAFSFMVSQYRCFCAFLQRLSLPSR